MGPPWFEHPVQDWFGGKTESPLLADGSGIIINEKVLGEYQFLEIWGVSSIVAPPPFSVLTLTMAVITELLNSPYVVQSVCVALVAVFITSFWADIANEIPHRHIPLVGKTWWELTNKKARQRFTQSSRQLITEGFAKVSLKRNK